MLSLPSITTSTSVAFQVGLLLFSSFNMKFAEINLIIFDWLFGH